MAAPGQKGTGAWEGVHTPTPPTFFYPLFKWKAPLTPLAQDTTAVSCKEICHLDYTCEKKTN